VCKYGLKAHLPHVITYTYAINDVIMSQYARKC
jgi:hypothetical protein